MQPSSELGWNIVLRASALAFSHSEALDCNHEAGDVAQMYFPSYLSWKAKWPKIASPKFGATELSGVGVPSRSLTTHQ